MCHQFTSLRRARSAVIRASAPTDIARACAVTRRPHVGRQAAEDCEKVQACNECVRR